MLQHASFSHQQRLTAHNGGPTVNTSENTKIDGPLPCYQDPESKISLGWTSRRVI